MIITRAPLRLSFGGGGTDIPAHYEINGGHWFSLAIQKYIYVAINKRVDNQALIRWSKVEHIEDLKQTTHPILKSLFYRYNLPSNIEFTSLADIPAGTGLGSSGAFTVASILAARTYLGMSSTPEELAREATEIELGELKRSGGLQDQYISAIGGLREFKIDTSGHILSTSIPLSYETERFISRHMLLVYTSKSRDSAIALSSLSKKMKTSTADSVSNKVPNFDEYIKALKLNDHKKLASLLHRYWQVKRSDKNATTERVDLIYDTLINEGMLGGKLVGAGGGGFILAVCDDIHKLISKIKKHKLEYIEIQPDYVGSKIVL